MEEIGCIYICCCCSSIEFEDDHAITNWFGFFRTLQFNNSYFGKHVYGIWVVGSNTICRCESKVTIAGIMGTGASTGNPRHERNSKGQTPDESESVANTSDEFGCDVLEEDENVAVLSYVREDQTSNKDNVPHPLDKRFQKWRKYDGYKHWNRKAVLRIRGEIIAMIKDLEPRDEIKIILCGGTGEGKSSLINNLCAAIRGRFAVVAQHGAGDQQVTQWYREHCTMMGKDGKMTKLSFADTRGFSERPEDGASVAAIKACIMGKVANKEAINPAKTDNDWEQRDTKTTKASFIFFVVNATFVPDDGNMDRVETHKCTYQNFKQIRTFSYAQDIKVAAFLTNCDTLDEAVHTNVKYLYYSDKVKKKVEAFSRMIDVPKIRTYPIVNYKDNSNVTDRMVLQALIPLKECLGDILS